MSLGTRSTFYYGHEITAENYQLDFDEGSGELTAELNRGSYTATEFAVEVARAMNAAGAFTYTVTFDRTTRFLTIETPDGNFDILTNTGSHVGTSPFEVMGFSTAADHTGADTYTGETESGSSYTSQFPPQSYVNPDNLQKAVDATVHESASGDIQVFRFGVKRLIEMNLTMITNIDVGNGSIIRVDPSGVTNAQLFLQYAVKKNKMEFMEDSDDPSAFYKVLLESTPDDSKGVSYRLRELYGRNLPEFFETGVLQFRVVE